MNDTDLSRLSARARLMKIVLLLLVVLAASPVSAQAPAARIVAAETVEGEIAAGLTFVATVMPLKRATIGSAVDGRVVQLVAQEGQRVKRQQPLVQLLTETIELELAAAEAELVLRKYELEELENGSRPNEVEQSKARMMASEASFKYTKARRQRAEELYRSSAISQEEFDAIQAAAAEAEQNYYELRATHELTVEGPRLEKIAQARARVAVQQALVEQIKDRIKKYTVITRFDGYVVEEHVEEGSWIKFGDPVMELVALDEVEVEAFVAEQHVPHVRLGMNVRVHVPALPRQIFTGVVSSVVPQADLRARTFPVKIQVQNRIRENGPLLKAGMYAQVELPVGAKRKAVMVPKDALVLGGPAPQVFVVESSNGKTGTVRAVSVQLGVALPNLIQVEGQLEAGQLVVSEGNERLRPGQQVRITRVTRPQLETDMARKSTQ